MKTQRWMAVFLVAVVSALTALISERWWFVSALAVLGWIGTHRRLTWYLPRIQHLIAVLVLALVFAVQYRIRLDKTSGQDLNWVALTAWQTFSLLVLSVMVLTLFLGKPHRLPPSLALFAPAAALCAGQVCLIYENALMHRILETVGVLVAIGYLASHKIPFPSIHVRFLSRRRAIAAAGMILVLNTGWIAATVLYDNQDVVNILGRVLGWASAPVDTGDTTATTGGFHSSGRLHTLLDILLENQSEILLRVESETTPGYLQTEIFERFSRQQWHSAVNYRRIWPDQSATELVKIPGSGNLFALRPTSSRPGRSMNLWPGPGLRAKFFTPPGTAWLKIPLPWLLLAKTGICYHPGYQGGINYAIAVPAESGQERLDQNYLNSCLQLPSTLDPRIETLALLILSECRTTSDKIAAVQSYFRQNYEYSLHFSIPKDADALNHFLLEMRTGYCEYFATAAAVLLRLGGVPTRYVTGFFVNEQEPFKELWVARSSDAHAWVEAWDEQNRQWILVEATVPSVMDAVALSDPDYLREHLDFRRQELWAFFYEFGLLGPFFWFFQTSQSLLWWLASLPAIVGIGCWIAIWLRRRLNKRIHPADPFSAEPPIQQQCHRILQKMDAYVRQWGFQRNSIETLHQFAQRLEASGLLATADAVSPWYRLYAETRYGRKSLPGYLERLQTELEDIIKKAE
ncbi:MAG: transglutaminase domain-containing protein [Sedimentisphaerales bacterium]|nr:transglutaminase domain-containing protein [Sedimentisphaerales bacterium]